MKQSKSAATFWKSATTGTNAVPFILTSQVPIAHWHEQIGDPSIADSILDQLVHNAFRIELKNGESMRKKRGRKAEEVVL